jgi:hypothetical protein
MGAKSISATVRFRLSSYAIIEVHPDDDQSEKITTETSAPDTDFNETLSTRLGLALMPPIGMNCINSKGTFGVKG